MTVAELIEVLSALDPKDGVEKNRVGNLSVMDAKTGVYKGYVDLRTGEVDILTEDSGDGT